VPFARENNGETTMRYLYALSIGVLSLTACSVQPQDDEAPLAGQDELINGHVATEAEYPATVSLGGCTGVKVGPRHFLTAAHCVSNPQSVTQVSLTARNDASGALTLAVASANNHPQWESCTECLGDGSMHDFGLRPDISLIIVQQLTPEIPIAEIDATPVAVGSDITLAGYGCENIQPAPPPRLKVGDSESIDPLDLDPATTIPGGYVTSYGYAVVPNAPSLCPGDSGGPLYRTGTNKVIGINALLSGHSGGVVGNWFTRVDSQSRYDVHGWLSGLIAAPVPTPCTGLCAAPTPVTSQYFSSGPLGTGDRCFESFASIVSGNCGGFAPGRTFAINSTNMTSDGTNWTLPQKRNNGYCFRASAGLNSWAWFGTW
jgi:hypothetical protein